jgi:hypothetical protein
LSLAYTEHAAVYGAGMMVRTQDFVQVIQFQDGREGVTDGKRSGHLTTSSTDPKVPQMVKNDC